MDASEQPILPDTVFLPASDSQRMGAFVVDLIVTLMLAVLLPLVGRIVAAIYLIERDALPFLHGQSVGKRVFHLQAVHLDGAPLTHEYLNALRRNGTLILPPVSWIVEIVAILISPAQKRLGDRLAHTRVIEADPVPIYIPLPIRMNERLAKTRIYPWLISALGHIGVYFIEPYRPNTYLEEKTAEVTEVTPAAENLPADPAPAVAPEQPAPAEPQG
ncbi:MAG: RDD family protein [Bacteroidia bacterium]|nr:RDD family protein [Bacteroidia bacterium]